MFPGFSDDHWLISFVVRDFLRWGSALSWMVFLLCGQLCNASESILFITENVRLAPQTIGDIEDGRPALLASRPQFHGINQAGVLVGTGWNGGASSTGTYSYRRPFYYSFTLGTIANLGDLSGDFGDPAVEGLNQSSEALAVNDKGWVVGKSWTESGARPFLWLDANADAVRTVEPEDEMIELDLNPGAKYGACEDISNSGYLIISGDTGCYRARIDFNDGLWSEPAPRILVTTSGVSRITVNDLGVVVYSPQGSSSQGRIWRDMNQNDQVDPNEIAVIPSMSQMYPGSRAYGINNAGQVCGTMKNDMRCDIGYLWTDLDNDHCCDWNDIDGDGIFDFDETSDEFERFTGDNNPIYLVPGNTFAHNLNDVGAVVGGFAVQDRYAFIWSKKFGALNLNQVAHGYDDIHLSQAYAINNRFQIAAYGTSQVPGEPVVESLMLLTPADCDYDDNCIVNTSDFSVFAGHWKNKNCARPFWCNDADLDRNGRVDYADIHIIASQWLLEPIYCYDSKLLNIPMPVQDMSQAADTSEENR